MRIILYTGKGGVGKTSVAAATALKSAEMGNKTLVVSTDAAHSLGDSLDMNLSPEPALIADNLWAQEIDATHEVESGWGQVQKYLTALLTSKAVKDITTEELTVLPGIEDLLCLLRILGYYKEGEYDVIIIDCAPTGETLALLSFPEILRWWVEKLFPMEKRLIKITRPIIEPLFGIPMPSNNVMDELENICDQLDEIKQILSNREITSIRLVTNPEKMVIKEAQRSFTYLNIYNYNVDAVIINKVIPDNVSDDYFKVWKDIQKNYIEMTKNSFESIPIYYAPWFEREVVGTEMLKRMANDVFKGENPTEIKYNFRTYEIAKTEFAYTLSIYLPFSDKEDLLLNQKGDELIIQVGKVKRNITLPKTLVGMNISGAKFEEDTLKITFLKGGEQNAN